MDDTGAAFGIAAQTYLQDLCAEEDPKSLAAKAKISEKMSTYFPHAVDIASDLEIGWGFFDSVRNIRPERLERALTCDVVC